MVRPVVVKALRGAIAARFPSVRVSTEIPSDLTGKVVVIERFGGPDGPLLDHPKIDLDVFAPTLSDAYDLAEELRHFMRRELPGTTSNGLTFNDVRTISGPSRAPYSNTGTRRITAAYSLAVH